VEAAARAGEEGRVVRSVLGRTCPPPSAAWRAITLEASDPEAERDPGAGRASRARGRFTRNFVVQGSAADWALVMLAALRRRLAALPPLTPGRWDPGAPHLVFFQHDEVLVHCPQALAQDVVAAVTEAAAEAGRTVFGVTQVRFPMTTAVVSCYADAK
jgi:DNA polymerase-1